MGVHRLLRLLALDGKREHLDVDISGLNCERLVLSGVIYYFEFVARIELQGEASWGIHGATNDMATEQAMNAIRIANRVLLNLVDEGAVTIPDCLTTLDHDSVNRTWNGRLKDKVKSVLADADLNQRRAVKAREIEVRRNTVQMTTLLSDSRVPI